VILPEDRARDSQRGRRTAALFRKHRLPGVERRCNVDAICADDELEILESDMADPGYTACLFCNPYGVGGAIWLVPAQDGGRRRFSIAHELGHYHLPTHRRLRSEGAMCGEPEMRAGATDPAELEWEANDFASELLMPTRQFGVDAARRDFSVATARELASDAFYEVSVTAAAWRMVQLSKHSCAIVVSSGGTVDWSIRSESLRIPGMRRGTRVNNRTVASGAFEGGASETAPLEVDVTAWLEPRYPVRGRLLESTHLIRSTAQVLSMLWLVDEEEAEAEY
jgi:hypothetical protein